MSERERVFQKLQSLGIDFEVFEHPIVHTIEEMEAHGICDKGTVCKNLFLRNQNGKKHYLVILDKDRKVEIQSIKEKIGSTRLSFASDERLEKYMKLKSGAVGPFGLMNDEECKVEVVIDADLEGKERLGFHPNDNTATIWICYEDLMKYIRDMGHKVFMLH